MKTKKEHSAQTEFLYITVSFFILVAAWVGFNLYHTWATSTITQDLQMQIIPIAPSFNNSVIQNLKTRTQVAPLDSFPNTAVFMQSGDAASGEAQSSGQSTLERVGL